MKQCVFTVYCPSSPLESFVEPESELGLSGSEGRDTIRIKNKSYGRFRHVSAVVGAAAILQAPATGMCEKGTVSSLYHL